MSAEARAEHIVLPSKNPSAYESVRGKVKSLVNTSAKEYNLKYQPETLDGNEKEQRTITTNMGDRVTAMVDKGENALNPNRVVVDENNNQITLIVGEGEMGNDVDSARICANSISNIADVSEAYRDAFTTMASAEIYGDANLVQVKVIKDEAANKFIEIYEIGEDSKFTTLVFDNNGNIMLWDKTKDMPVKKGYRVLVINKDANVTADELQEIAKTKNSKKAIAHLKSGKNSQMFAILDIK